MCFDLPRHVLGCGALCPRGLGFLYQRFSSLLRNEACLFRNQQSRTVVNLATIVLSGTRSIKGEVKKKHISFGWKFSCFAAHLIERDVF